MFLISPARAPDAPTSVSAIVSDKQAVVSFTVPAFDGGLPISSYSVVSDPSVQPWTGSANASGSGGSVLATGLSNGVQYKFSVKAQNPMGWSEFSNWSDTVTPG